MAYALVGTAGAASATGTSETPAWDVSETRVAGHLLICWAYNTGASKPVVSTPLGWSSAVSQVGGSSSVAIFWKIAAGGDVAPTITFGASNGFASVAEFSGNDTTSPLDQSGSNTITTNTAVTATTGGPDAASGELLVYISSSHKSGSNNTNTLTNSLANGSVTAHDTVNTGSVSSAWHFAGGYGIGIANTQADNDIFQVATTTSINDMTVAVVSFKLAGIGPVVPVTHNRTLLGVGT